MSSPTSGFPTTEGLSLMRRKGLPFLNKTLGHSHAFSASLLDCPGSHGRPSQRRAPTYGKVSRHTTLPCSICVGCVLVAADKRSSSGYGPCPCLFCGYSKVSLFVDSCPGVGLSPMTRWAFSRRTIPYLDWHACPGADHLCSSLFLHTR